MAQDARIEQTDDKLHLHLPTRFERQAALELFDGARQAMRNKGAPAGLTLHLGPVRQWDTTGLGVILQLHSDCTAKSIDWQVDETDAVDGFRSAVSELHAVDPHAEADSARSQSLVLWLGELTASLCRDFYLFTTFVGDLLLGVLDVVLHPARVRWRQVLLYMDRTGSEALPITGMITFLMGLILGFQSSLQLHKLGGDPYVAYLVGIAICRELGPLMVAMICTGRAGSAFAAEIGTMKVNEEIDALQTMGLDRTRFLIVPKLLGLTIVMPLLTLYGDVLGVLGGLVATTSTLSTVSYNSYLARTLEALTMWDIGQGLIKSVVFAVLIASVGCLRGLQTRRSAEDVGRATTSAVVTSIFLIVVFDTALTMIFSRFTPL